VTDNTARVVDAEFAQQINPKALMFYRPFPHKAMKAKDLFLFGLKSVYTADIIRFVVLALVGTLIGLLLPYMNEQLYDRFIPMGNSRGLVELCGVILACTMGNATFTIVKNLATFRSMNSMEYAVQSATYDRLFILPQNFLQQYDSADLAQRAMGISTVYNSLSDVVVKTLLSAVFSLLYLFRMFKYSKKLSWTSLFVLIVCMAIIVWIGIQQTKYEREKLEKEMESQSLMHQLLMGIAKVRIAGIENRALYEYLKPYVATRKINIRAERMTVFVNAFVGGLSTVFSMIFYYIMIKKTISMSVGEFMGFTAAFGSFSSAMLEIVSSLLKVNDVKPVYDFCKPILENLPEFEEDAQMPGNLTGDIEVNNVTFAYNEESGPVLKNLSLHINAGEYVVIVGSSGSGKSTLLKLLLGFDKPQLGKIYYDGKDIDSIDKRELRKKFGVVLQDGGVISGSIYENITITSPNTKLKRVKEVVREVGLEDDINAMPMGLHTVLSENSGTISGGQKQRILIARAIVGKPKIIFFDEATSALDNVTQAMVVETLEKLKATKIVIAHRLSTVMNCDRIVVLEHGELIEQGTYQELMDKKGRFYELAIRQIS
jgi:ATP-binding cassette subfamily C protein